MGILDQQSWINFPPDLPPFHFSNQDCCHLLWQIINATHKHVIEIVFFHSGIFVLINSLAETSYPSPCTNGGSLNAAKSLRATGPGPGALCHRSWLLLCNPSPLTHHPGSYQKKSGIWCLFLSQLRFWFLSFISVSGSKLLKQRRISLLNSTSFIFGFLPLRYVPVLVIFHVPLCKEIKINLLCVSCISLLRLFRMLLLLIIHF